ncbi:hypothetical protein [Sulfuracidifex metallicus]|uniref:hypothetical protein n=1 Tax=Sulfuracidifex metallicus TaxID=47303 RepID=UPI000B0EA6EF|nr:hypothetical protein [Sulfuracidifex metallicus]WOE51815.1 hypothetical protein RQ359_001150 [Sulfuracidifex metallicus DSM 6482 = JCM 9184]
MFVLIVVGLLDRDYNASLNILSRGWNDSACGSETSTLNGQASSVKQEAPSVRAW